MGGQLLLAVDGLADASAWALYGVGTALALAGAFGVVLLRNPVHCALCLVTTIFGIALLFLDQGADFLAAIQIIVYAGAIVILFLFVIMLLGVDRTEARQASTRLRGMGVAGTAAGIVALAELLVLARVHYWASGAKASTQAANGPGQNVQKLGESIFTAYLLPFEMTSALLVIAVVAAVALVRRSTTPEAAGPGRRTSAGRAPVRPGPGPAARVPTAAASSAPVSSRAGASSSAPAPSSGGAP